MEGMRMNNSALGGVVSQNFVVVKLTHNLCVERLVASRKIIFDVLWKQITMGF